MARRALFAAVCAYARAMPMVFTPSALPLRRAHACLFIIQTNPFAVTAENARGATTALLTLCRRRARRARDERRATSVRAAPETASCRSLCFARRCHAATTRALRAPASHTCCCAIHVYKCADPAMKRSARARAARRQRRARNMRATASCSATPRAHGKEIHAQKRRRRRKTRAKKKTHEAWFTKE